MEKKTTHKFQEDMLGGMTYEQYFQDMYRGTVGLAQAFERALGRERAYEIIADWAEKEAVDSTKSQLSAKPIKSFRDFVRYMKEESTFGAHVLTKTYPEETPGKLCCRITECLWAETFRKMDAADLGYNICCRPDFALARAYHPNIRLKRTKTLMQGDGCCNHTYYWEE